MRARSVDITGSFRSILPSPFPIHQAEISLLSGSVEQIFQEFPLFDNVELLDRAKRQGVLGTEISGHAAGWACVNAAIALAVHVKIANCSFEELSLWSWTYFKNAYATFPELSLHGDDMETLQAMVLMALFARSSADARMTSHLVSTALRLSQTLDPWTFSVSHDKDNNETGNVESEYARRALWAAFILDAELFLPSTLGSTLDPGNMDIPLPSENNHQTTPTSFVRVFRWRAELALIQTRVNNRLYTHHGLKMPKPELLGTIAELDQELELWRQTLPPSIRPGVTHSDLEPPYIGLHISFHNIVSMIHWTARRHIPPAPATPDQPTKSRSKARTAAQNTLRILHSSYPEQFAQFWYVTISPTIINSPSPQANNILPSPKRRTLDHPLSAALTLLLYILEDPQDLQAKPDTHLIKQYGHQIQAMHNSGDFDLSALLKTWHALKQMADVAVGQPSQDETVISSGDKAQVRET